MSAIAFSRASFRRTQLALKPLAILTRYQKTEAIPKETSYSADSEEHGARPFEEIPGPKHGIGFIVGTYMKSEGFTKLHRVTDSLYSQHGPIFKQEILGFPAVHIMDPEDYEKVYRAEGKYPRRITVEFWREHRRRRKIFPGILNLDGEEWHRVRQAVAPKIMRPKIVEENLENFNAVAKDTIARFIMLKESSPQGEIPDLEKELCKWSTESIGTLAFDARLGLYNDPPSEEAIAFINAVQEFFEYSQKLLMGLTHQMLLPYMDTPLFKKFLKCCDVIWDVGQSFVDKKMHEIKEMADKDIDENQVVPLLTYLLLKNQLSPEEVNGMAVDVVGAGVDTTSNSVLWLLYHLSRHQEVQEQVYQEVHSLLGNDGDVTSQSLAKLSYLKACLKESMRLTPAFPSNSRRLDSDIVLSGYNVPAQTLIVTDFYQTALSDKYFSDPLKFKPERWLRENKNEMHAFASLPFGFGPRMCIGRRVAELEMYLLLCKILQRFRLEYHQDPVGLYHKVLAVPDRQVKIKFVDRV